MKFLIKKYIYIYMQSHAVQNADIWSIVLIITYRFRPQRTCTHALWYICMYEFYVAIIFLGKR
jgi:hypothetical protein